MTDEVNIAARGNWQGFLASLTPRQRALQAEADRLDKSWKKFKGKNAKDIKEAHHAIINQLQEELIPPKSKGVYVHSDQDYQHEITYKCHAKIKTFNKRSLHENRPFYSYSYGNIALGSERGLLCRPS